MTTIRTARRKAQKRLKRRKHRRCQSCGGMTDSRLKGIREYPVMVVKCRNCELEISLGGGIGRRIPRSTDGESPQGCVRSNRTREFMERVEVLGIAPGPNPGELFTIIEPCPHCRRPLTFVARLTVDRRVIPVPDRINCTCGFWLRVRKSVLAAPAAAE